MSSVLTARARRRLGLSVSLIASSLAIQSVMSAHWARAFGVSQEAALVGIVAVHAAMVGIGFWRVRRCVATDQAA